MNKKLGNSIGFFSYGLKDTNTLVEVLGLCLLVDVNSKPLLIVNKLLLSRVPDGFIPKFIFKNHRDDSVHAINTFQIGKNSFTTHFSDTKNLTHNIAVAPPKTGTEKFNLIDVPINFTNPILLNHEEIKIATVAKEGLNIDFFSNKEPTNIHLLDGKVYNAKDKIEVNNKVSFSKQSLVNIHSKNNHDCNLNNHFYTGSLAFIFSENRIIPIGLINAAIEGTNKRFLEHNTDSTLYLVFTNFRKIMEILHKKLGFEFDLKYDSPAEYYLDNVTDLRDNIERIIDEELSKKIKQMHATNLSTKVITHVNERMSAIRGELLSFRFNLVMLEQNLLDKEWWDFVHRNNAPDLNQKKGLISYFDRTIVRSFTIGFFSVMEHILRDTLRTVDKKAVNNARGEFSKVYNYYLERIDIDRNKKEQYKKLLRTYSNIRNSIHNDGRIFRRWNQDETITINYKGRDYIFEDGKGLNFNLHTYIYLSEEIISFLWVLLKSGYVTKNLTD